MLTRVKGVFREFPGPFWTLMGGTFIDHLGSAMLFTFFALYITEKFNVGMTTVGTVFAVYSIVAFFGSTMSGALTDKFGRRAMIIFGMLASALSSLVMPFINDLSVFYIVTAVVGLLATVGGPARQAMIADLLPEEKRAEGYGIHRVTFNLSAAIGPAIGGILASISYNLLFYMDAVTSVLMAALIYFKIPETKPELAEGQEEETILQSVGGYREVFKDGIFMAFIGVCILMVVVYFQMNSTLSVYLRDVHQIALEQFGAIISLNAGMVVVMQFWITRRLSGQKPMIMMAAGMALYAIGFAMYGFIGGSYVFAMAMVAMVVITIGEMIIAPFQQVIVAKLAPEHMRGRYMAIFGISWGIPTAFAPLLAGVIMDNYDPRWVWWGVGIIGIVATLGFWRLHFRAEDRMAEIDASAADAASEAVTV
ncbi:MAG: MFS transporter [Anaerolineales bacterium]